MVKFLVEAKGFTIERALALTYKDRALFGEPDKGQARGEDRPLPPELMPRVNAYINSQARDTVKFAAMKAQATSMNALIRNEMKSGRL